MIFLSPSRNLKGVCLQGLTFSTQQKCWYNLRLSEDKSCKVGLDLGADGISSREPSESASPSDIQQASKHWNCHLLRTRSHLNKAETFLI